MLIVYMGNALGGQTQNAVSAGAGLTPVISY